MDLTQKQIDYFWARVDKSGGDDACWNWTGGLYNKNGYGRVKHNGKSMGTHVLALTLFAGAKPIDRPYACHNCKQNRKCCNPKHLRWDTHDGNMRDRDKDGTTAKQKGELHGCAKLTELQVKEIREKYAPRKYSQQKLSEEYGVTKSLICLILKRKLWTHI